MMSKVQLSCRLMTVNQRCSNFVVIEAAKAGTSSLKRVLKKSPGTDKYKGKEKRNGTPRYFTMVILMSIKHRSL